MRFDDFIFTGPGNDPIQVRLMLCLDGTLEAYRPGPGFFAGTNSEITLFGNLNGQSLTDAVVPGGAGAFGAVSASIDNLGGWSVERHGLLSQFGDVTYSGTTLTVDGADNFFSKWITVPVNTPVVLDLSMRSRAFSWSGAPAFSNFGSTMNFPFDQPVFLLPEGYTVNSASANIANNQYAVPEPTAGLLVLVVGSFAAIQRRRTIRPIHSS
jgi:hypothetical protein